MHNETSNQVPGSSSDFGKKPNVLMAVIAYVIFFIPLLTDAKEDPFVKFHVKQGLALLVLSLGGNMVLGAVPFFGWLAMVPFNFFVVVLWVFGVIHALSGTQKGLPLVGKLAEKFTF